MKSVVLHPLAKIDLRESAQWYNSQRPGLGGEFREEVEAALLRITRSPEMFGTILPDIRSHRMHRFPFGIIYRVEPTRIFVFAVMHLHREPDYWKDRV